MSHIKHELHLFFQMKFVNARTICCRLGSPTSTFGNRVYSSRNEVFHHRKFQFRSCFRSFGYGPLVFLPDVWSTTAADIIKGPRSVLCFEYDHFGRYCITYFDNVCHNCRRRVSFFVDLLSLGSHQGRLCVLDFILKSYF